MKDLKCDGYANCIRGVDENGCPKEEDSYDDIWIFENEEENQSFDSVTATTSKKKASERKTHVSHNFKIPNQIESSVTASSKILQPNPIILPEAVLFPQTTINPATKSKSTFEFVTKFKNFCSCFGKYSCKVYHAS